MNIDKVSKIVEFLFSQHLQEFYPNAAKEFAVEFLLETAERVLPGRVENVQNQRVRNGLPRLRFEVVRPAAVIDMIYGLDYIARAGGKSLYGFDWTLDKDKLKTKVEKLREFKPLWESLGVISCAVVLVKPPTRFDRLYFIIEEFDELMYDLAESPPGCVKSYEVKFYNDLV